MNCHDSCWFALYVLAAQLEALARAVAGCVVVVVLRTHLGSVGYAWVMRRGGRKRGARDSEGDGGRPTRGLGLAREGAACGHGARMPSRCGRCCVRRDGLAWSGRCVNGRWQGGGKQGGCRRQGTGGSGWRRQGGWRSCGGWHLEGRFGGEENHSLQATKPTRTATFLLVKILFSQSSKGANKKER